MVAKWWDSQSPARRNALAQQYFSCNADKLEFYQIVHIHFRELPI